MAVVITAEKVSRTAAMPETMAEKMKTIGIRGEDHQGFALIDPKMKPTYPCRRKAEGIPMTVIGYNAKLLRDQAGNNLYYNTNSITLAGGESLDVILDATNTALYPSGSVFYLYTPNLDHLSNDAENFGGLMTEVHIN